VRDDDDDVHDDVHHDGDDVHDDDDDLYDVRRMVLWNHAKQRVVGE
jgi:hypothetical protein